MSSDAAGFKMPNLVFKKFLMPYLLHASWLTFFIVSQCTADILEESNTFRIKSSLVAWLISTSESDEDFISDNLVLNRVLEKKGCPFPITFTFAATNKRLVKAECGDTWRRFIKIPPRVKFKPFDEVDPILAESRLTEALLLMRPIKKNEPITQNDFSRERISGLNSSLLALDLDMNEKMRAAHNLNKGDALLKADILIGQNVITAKTTIPSGSILTKELAGIEMRYRDIPEDAISSTQGWDFMETNRNVISGEVLRERHFRKAKLVRRNDPVTLMSKSASIEIFTSGTASQDGYYGQQVKVTNSESGRVILGKVIGRGRVEINQNPPNL